MAVQYLEVLYFFLNSEEVYSDLIMKASSIMWKLIMIMLLVSNKTRL
jgi:hypothetical protein